MSLIEILLLIIALPVILIVGKLVFGGLNQSHRRHAVRSSAAIAGTPLSTKVLWFVVCWGAIALTVFLVK